jgi:hypothetical protein
MDGSPVLLGISHALKVSPACIMVVQTLHSNFLTFFAPPPRQSEAAAHVCVFHYSPSRKRVYRASRRVWAVHTVSFRAEGEARSRGIFGCEAANRSGWALVRPKIPRLRCATLGMTRPCDE